MAMKLQRECAVDLISLAIGAVTVFLGVRMLGKAVRPHRLEREHPMLVRQVHAKVDRIREGS